MKTYGPILFSTAGAPQLFAGIRESYTYKKSETFTEVPGEGETAALVRHGAKGAISFSAKPPASIIALPVRAGAQMTIEGNDTPTSGITICTNVSAKWQKLQAMNIDLQATNYPDLEGEATGAITPGAIVLAYGGNVALQMPVGKVWWGVAGLAPFTESGIVQSATISESVQIQEEEGSGDKIGKIIAIAVHTYKGTASMEVLTTDSLPDAASTLEVFGNFKVTDAEVKKNLGASRLIMVNGILIPGVTD